MKKFKSKKIRKKYFLKILMYICIIYITYQTTTNILLDFKLEKSNEDFIIALLNDSNHHLLYEKRKNNLLDKVIKYIGNIDINRPVSMLKKVFGYEFKEEKQVVEEVEDEVITNYIEDPNPISVDKPIVYIYNTHQLESYNATNYTDYNITPNVLMASYLLKERLNNLGIGTIVETANINDFLSLNGWSYSASYKASRYYVEDTIKKNPNLKLIIDLHRDAIPKSSSTITIDGKNYAKILFVIGKEYDHYEENLEIANKINEIIKEKYPLLTRGVITKEGENVNGIYNQDLSNKIILIECGGNENTIDEVMNTIEVLSKAIKKYIGD